jgi:prephenate dehydrogenase
MWRDVCLANRDALRRDLGSYRDELDRVESLLAAADGDGLLRLFERARAIRDGWLQRQSGGDEV